MAKARLSMRKIREILRLKWGLGRSHRDVAKSLSVGLGTISEVVGRAKAAGLTLEDVEALTEGDLEGRVYGAPGASRSLRPPPDLVWVDTELRKKGVTLQLLHLEYLEAHPDGHRYSRFCQVYRAWKKRQRPTMRQVHRAGEKLFVDYAGKKPCYVDRSTGEIREADLFVAVLGASNFTYAGITETQRSPDFIESHVKALAYIEGVPGAIVPDQLKSGVSRSCRYEPGVQRTYEEMAAYYGTVVLPARPGKSRDKAKVEAGVLVAERWILARLRNQTHFSVASLAAAVPELLEELNDRRMKVYGESRRELFERLERPALKPLPAKPFVYAEWRLARVNIDYHVQVDHHYYSVPHPLVHEEVEVRLTARTVEVYRKGRRVASHPRSHLRGRHTTVPEHMPKSHRKHLEWTPSRIIRWAETIGVKTAELVREILASRPHPEQGYRSCLGILRLAKRYGEERLEVACARAVAVKARSYRHVDSILKNGMDRLPLFDTPPAKRAPPAHHENIRGGDYYDDEEGEDDDADGTDGREAPGASA